MNKFYIFLVLALFVLSSFKSDNPAYMMFSKEGKNVKYSKMVEDMGKADVVLFGEIHDNPISHWLELEITKDLYKLKNSNLILGAEMFETDNQLILNEYMDNLISQSRFEDEAKLWPDYQTDYKPLVEFARKNKLKFAATNIPRRYASLVNAKGFEGLQELSDEAKAFLPPLPIEYDPELSCYKNMVGMEGMPVHMSENLPKAQAIKDATMAYSILKFWSPGKLMIHYDGSYHSDNFEGIYWYLKKKDPNLNIVTITTVQQDDVTNLEKENTGLADYTICVNADMTKTR